MSELRGTFEHLSVVDEQLKQEGLKGILIGGLARAHHLAQRNREAALALLPRKDTDVLIVNENREDVILDLALSKNLASPPEDKYEIYNKLSPKIFEEHAKMT